MTAAGHTPSYRLTECEPVRAGSGRKVRNGHYWGIIGPDGSWLCRTVFDTEEARARLIDTLWKLNNPPTLAARLARAEAALRGIVESSREGPRGPNGPMLVRVDAIEAARAALAAETGGGA